MIKNNVINYVMRIFNLPFLFFFLFALNSYSLHECEGDPTKWSNCSGTLLYPEGAQYEGEWQYDEMHGQGIMTD